MKRLFLILLIFVYSGSISGATFHLHFCGESLQIVSFAGIRHDDCCCGKETPKKENCCTDTVITVKVNDDHTSGEAHVVPVSAVKAIPSPKDAHFVSYCSPLVNYSDHFHPPPPDYYASQPSLLVLNCIFRV